MKRYPDCKPRLNQTVYIKRPEWKMLLPARYTEKGFACSYRGCNFTIGAMECLYIANYEILWTIDRGACLAQ